MQRIFAEKNKKERKNEKKTNERLNEHVAREEDLTGATHKIIPPHPSGCYRWKTETYAADGKSKIHRLMLRTEKR